MILLTPRTDTLKIVTATGADINYSISYTFLGATSPTIYDDVQGAITTATTTTVINGENASFPRQVTGIIINNIDVTANTVTVIHSINAVDTIILPATVLQPLGRIEYTDSNGFVVYRPDGSVEVEIDGVSTADNQEIQITLAESSDASLSTIKNSLTSGSQKTQIVDAGGEQATVTGNRLDVNVDTSALSTSALQAAGNSSLSAIDAKTLALGLTSVNNSTSAPLNAGATFTGVADLNLYSEVLVTCYTDQNGTLYVEFSSDGSNWDSSTSYSVSATTNEIHRFVKAGRYYRVRFTNTSASNQTYLRLNSYYGSFSQLTSSLNSVVQIDADAITTRAISDELAIGAGLFQGYSVVQKFGRNTDVDAGTIPEDVWFGSNVYTGFPTTAPEIIQAVSTNIGDTGTVTFTYLATSTSTAYQTATVVLNGTTPVNSGVSAYRVHTAQYAGPSSTAFNLGDITIRHATTTANVFVVIPTGTSQSYDAVYRVPSGSTGKIKRLFCRIGATVSGNIQGALWVRTNGASPRLRRPFSASNTDHFEETPYSGITVTENSDIAIRITSASTNNLEIIAGFDLVLIKNE